MELLSKEDREKSVREGRNGGKLKTGGDHKRTGAPKGQRWSTLIEEAMESKAPKAWHGAAIDLGLSAKGQPITIRKAMLAKAITRYMEGELRLVGSGDDTHEVYVNVADPKIFTALSDREEGKSPQSHKHEGGEEPIKHIHHIVGFGDDA